MNSGRAERNAASRPETCGAAMLVPLIATYSFVPARHERMFSPGATTSGLARPSAVGPARREVRHAVHVRPVGVHRAHRDALLEVRRIPDRDDRVQVVRLVAVGAHAHAPVVAAGHDREHALPPQPPQLLAQRRVADAVDRGVERAAEAQVHPGDDEVGRLLVGRAM